MKFDLRAEIDKYLIWFENNVEKCWYVDQSINGLEFDVFFQVELNEIFSTNLAILIERKKL